MKFEGQHEARAGMMDFSVFEWQVNLAKYRMTPQ
jgi:hypothetical protein